jgi:hypothetical protein
MPPIGIAACKSGSYKAEQIINPQQTSILDFFESRNFNVVFAIKVMQKHQSPSKENSQINPNSLYI